MSELLLGDIQVSPIIAGVWKWGAWGHELGAKEQARIIEEAVDMGITTFDHADIYGGHLAEAEFGKALELLPGITQKIQIITKCGIALPGGDRPFDMKSYDTGRDHIRQSVDNSLRNLGVDCLDVLLIHRPSPLMDAAEMASTAAELIREGKIRSFGVSNFTVSQMALVTSHIQCATNQIEASLLHLEPYLDGTLDFMQQHRIRPTIWSPLGSGGLFAAEPSDRVMRIQRVAATLMEKYSASDVDQIYLSWIRQHPTRPIPVLGTAKPHRMRSAIASLSINLSTEDWFKLWTASTGEDVP